MRAWEFILPKVSLGNAVRSHSQPTPSSFATGLPRPKKFSGTEAWRGHTHRGHAEQVQKLDQHSPR